MLLIEGRISQRSMICTLLSLYTVVFSYLGVTAVVVSASDNNFLEIGGGDQLGSCHASSSLTSTMSTEQTLVIIKPDGVQRGLVGTIIARFEQKGFKLVAMKLMQASTDLLSRHYSDLSDRPFYPGLIKYMASGPVVPMVWSGPPGVIKTVRTMMGATMPADAVPGTIRGDLCIVPGRNLIHGSDSVESAKREIDMWFQDKERVQWRQAAEDWINSSN